eukprot:CAMPEP_0172320928 /NCGR_PEP_ID=MMETSP1058-20130122/41797_1 /TAXON_ID=83371 /ORGANISM="Detonula confervacea, Strain CCMP 353" /LENGTH=802 /DNA_ID=CAMNT_0013036289 /DNA_START=92 /DNA_END=2501 /DNA_ORIENTATION=+
MAKKERRLKGVGGTGKQNDATKQAAARRSQKLPIQKHLFWLRRNAPIVVLGAIAILAVLLFVSKTANDNHDGDGPGDDHPVPHIDGLSMDLDPERGNKTQDFLNNFVCNYQPYSEVKADAITTAVDIEGYCHPRLLAVPHHRTQRVSISRVTGSLTPTWWRKILNYFMTDEIESSRDHGIPKGELVMRLPRPLQIWDLDALRDRFIQQEFLGLGPSGSSDADTMERKSPKVAARHQDTQNPLDSGAFLTVYLIRLLHGSRAGISSSDVENDVQCQNESGQCKALQQWDNLEQHKQRITLLSAYLDILPTVSDRLAKSSSSHINPNGHPLFWTPTILKSLFPRYTHTYDLIRHYQQMIESEYETLKLMSDEFRKNVKYLEYLSMRINVLSRAFGVPASTDDSGLVWGTSGYTKGLSIVEEMRLYETSNFGSFLDDAQNFKLRSMCPLLDMYNSHPNPNVSWRYDSKTSSYVIRASKNSDIPPHHSLMVSYGTYTDGHLFAKYGFANGDGSSPTEISLAVFHRMLGDVGLGRQFSQLPFDVWDPKDRDEIFGTLLLEESHMDSAKRKSLLSAKNALEMQAKELLRYLMFDDGYKECIDLTSNPGSSDEELKLLKLRHLIRIANYREAWIVRVPPKFPDARPLQTMGSTKHDRKEQKNSVGVNANRIVSICRLLSLRVDDIGGGAIDYLREGITSYASPTASTKSFFLVEKHEDELEYRSMMCVVRLCNAALGRYLGYDNTEPEIVGTRQWNAWYVMTGEVRALGILIQTAASEANKVKRLYQSSKGTIAATDASMKYEKKGHAH